MDDEKRAELVKFLKENLTIQLETSSWSEWNGRQLSVELVLDGEVLSSDWVHLE